MFWNWQNLDLAFWGWQNMSLALEAGLALPEGTRVWISRFESAKQITSAESSIYVNVHDAFIDIQHFGWATRVVGNPR